MGIFQVQQYRNGRKIGIRLVHNDHTNLSIKQLAYSCSSDSPIYPQQPSFDIGFIDDAGFSSTNVTDTATSHPGWAEAPQARTNWPRDVVGTSDNPQPITTIVFASTVISVDQDLRGVFITTRAATPELLMATALFDAVLSVETGDTLEITYETAFQTPWP